MPVSPDLPAGTAPLAPTDPRTVGPYRTLGRLGVGGMGVVYLAEPADGPRVALKVVRPEIADQAHFRTRFAREVAAATTVAGTYSATVLDSDSDSSPQWIATEYVPGPTLAEHVETHGPMPEDQVRLLGLGLAEAIGAIHAAGLIHRDLKPSNVILSSDGPKVIDFGISQAADSTSLTQTGVYVGSLAWMSPEQVTGTNLNPATDMFSLGLLLAYASSGQHPFGEGRPEAVAFRMVNQTAHLDAVPASLQRLCGRLLSRTPHDRPTPETVISDLNGGATKVHEVTRVVGTGWDGTVAGTPPTIMSAQEAVHDVAPAKKRRRGLAVALAGTTALAAATAAVALGAIALPVGGQTSDAGVAATPNTTTVGKPTEVSATSPDPTAEAASIPPTEPQASRTEDSGSASRPFTAPERSAPYRHAIVMDYPRTNATHPQDRVRVLSNPDRAPVKFGSVTYRYRIVSQAVECREEYDDQGYLRKKCPRVTSRTDYRTITIHLNEWGSGDAEWTGLRASTHDGESFYLERTTGKVTVRDHSGRVIETFTRTLLGHDDTQ